MTWELWALSVVLAVAVLLVGYALLPDRPVTAPRSDHQPEHAQWRMDSPTWRLGAQLPGPVTEWPWGQAPARFMYDWHGNLVGPIPEPLAWMREQLLQVDTRD